MDLSSLISVGSFLLGASGSAAGCIKALRASHRRQIEQERAFAHLQRDNQQLREIVLKMDKDMEDLTATVLELRSALSILLRQSQPERIPSLPTFVGTGESYR